jgi:hypothetical protein
MIVIKVGSEQVSLSISSALLPLEVGHGRQFTWSDFGHTTMSNNGRQREPLSTILAGQPLSAQVAGARGTVYGSDGRLWRAHCVPDRHAACGDPRQSRRLRRAPLTLEPLPTRRA